MENSKKIVAIFLLSNIIFFIWNFSGNHSSGSIGMHPILFIITSLISFIGTLIINRFFKFEIKHLFACIFLIQEVSFPFLDYVTNKFWDSSSIPLLNLGESDIFGFISRGVVFSNLLAYFIIYFVFSQRKK